MNSFEIGDRVRIAVSEIDFLVGLCGELVYKRDNRDVFAVLIDGYKYIPFKATSNVHGHSVKVFNGPDPGTRWFSFSKLCHEEGSIPAIEESELLQIIEV
jgi:hypothetical protein